MIRQIPIEADDLPDGDYARRVVEMGHEPGVLSGAELKGRAREYGAWYARMRRRVARVVEYVTAGEIQDGYALIGHPARWCRVWVDDEGHPVQLNVTEGL